MKLFDSMVFTLPNAKPDTRKIGLLPCNLQGAYTLMTPEDPNNLRIPRLFKMDVIVQQAKLALQMGGPLVIDCEVRVTDGRTPNGEAIIRGTIAEFSWVLDQARAAAPGVQVGLWGVVPNFVNLTQAFDEQIAAVQAANNLLSALYQHVDFVIAPMYLSMDSAGNRNTLGDFLSWLPSVQQEHARLCALTGRQIPVWPWLRPRYTGGTGEWLPPGLLTEMVLGLRREGVLGAGLWEADATTPDVTKVPIWQEIVNCAASPN